MEINPVELAALARVLDFIDRPGSFGCSIFLGTDETYYRRIGHVFEAAEDALSAILSRAENAKAEGAGTSFPMTEVWSDDEQLSARAEGWGLHNNGLGIEIEAEDASGFFANDDEALAHVEARAAEGRELHMKAIRAINAGSPTRGED